MEYVDGLSPGTADDAIRDEDDSMGIKYDMGRQQGLQLQSFHNLTVTNHITSNSIINSREQEGTDVCAAETARFEPL